MYSHNKQIIKFTNYICKHYATSNLIILIKLIKPNNYVQ